MLCMALGPEKGNGSRYITPRFDINVCNFFQLQTGLNIPKILNHYTFEQNTRAEMVNSCQKYFKHQNFVVLDRTCFKVCTGHDVFHSCCPGVLKRCDIPYPTAFPYGNGMVLHFYQQQESSTTKTVHKVINKGLKTYV